MPRRAGALIYRHAVGPIGEKVPVIRLGVGVVVAALCGHELHVFGQEVRGVVAPDPAQRAHEQSGAQRIEGVLAGLHALVVVPVSRAPMMLFTFKNDLADHVPRLSTSAPAGFAGQGHDGTRVQ